MTEIKASKEQIRKLKNEVQLCGYLAELNPMRTGVTVKDSVPYLAFDGAIQCGETPDRTVRFRTFIKSKKQDGSDSVAFANAKAWYEAAVPMTKDPEHATRVEMRGSLTDNPFVNSENKLIEATQFNIQAFFPFTPKAPEDYKAVISLEGVITGYSPEIVNENETGRSFMRFMTRDIFGNVIELKNIVVPNDTRISVDILEANNYDVNTTTEVGIVLTPARVARVTKQKGGIGTPVAVVTEKDRIEWVLSYANNEETQQLSRENISAMRNARESALDRVKKDGYKGTAKKPSAPVAGVGASEPDVPPTTKSYNSVLEDLNDMPF